LTTNEPRNLELEELIGRDFQKSEAALLQYASWLEERGEPRGALIRLQIEAKRDTENQLNRLKHEKYPLIKRPWQEREARALVAEHWDQWFPGVSTKDVEFGWEAGFVRRATWRASSKESCGQLLSLPSLRFLRSLEIPKEYGGNLEGLSMAKALESLDIDIGRPGLLDALRGQTLTSLVRLFAELSAAPGGPELRALAQTGLPQMRELTLAFAVADEAVAFEELVQAPWLRSLEMLDLSFRSPATASTLLKASGILAPLEKGLRFRLPTEAWGTLREEFRKTFPEARLFPVPESSPPDFTYSRGGPTVTAQPVHAPMNYRELIPWTPLKPEPPSSYRKRDGGGFGSGIPVAQASPYLFALCCNCASHNTLCIYEETSSVYCHYETTAWTTVELVCQECGQYTSYGTIHYR
jgi:hypothetical protein